MAFLYLFFYLPQRLAVISLYARRIKVILFLTIFSCQKNTAADGLVAKRCALSRVSCCPVPEVTRCRKRVPTTARPWASPARPDLDSRHVLDRIPIVGRGKSVSTKRQPSSALRRRRVCASRLLPALDTSAQSIRPAHEQCDHKLFSRQ